MRNPVTLLAGQARTEKKYMLPFSFLLCFKTLWSGVAASTAGVAVTALFSCLVKDAKPEDDHGDHGGYQGI